MIMSDLIDVGKVNHTIRVHETSQCKSLVVDNINLAFQHSIFTVDEKN